MNIGIVGLGRWGTTLAGAFSRLPDVTIVALCDSDPVALQKAGALHPSSKRFTEMHPLLRTASLDAVAIATPPATHASLSLAALSCRKHVFVEKPMTLSLATALHVANRAVAVDRCLMVGHVVRYHPGVQELVRLANHGSLGVVRGTRSYRTACCRTRTPESVWWALAAHDVSLACAVLHDRPTYVSAHCSRASAVHATIRFAGGQQARMRVQWTDGTPQRQTMVLGTRETAFLDERAEAPHWLERLPSRTRTFTLPLRRDLAAAARQKPGPGDGAANPLQIEARTFVDASIGGHPIPTDGLEGCQVVAVLEAGAKSLRARGLPIRVPAIPSLEVTSLHRDTQSGQGTPTETRYHDAASVAEMSLSVSSELDP